MKQAAYNDIRNDMHPGDVIAFGGRGAFADLIRAATRSVITHVGVVMHTSVFEDNRYFNLVCQSTVRHGVQATRLSDVIRRYAGEVWWLPLEEPLEHTTEFYDFLFDKEGAAYDLPQALLSAVRHVENEEDLAKLYCAELVAAALEVAEVIGPINASEVTPIDLCLMGIFKESYQLKGDRLEI